MNGVFSVEYKSWRNIYNAERLQSMLSIVQKLTPFRLFGFFMVVDITQIGEDGK